MYIVRKRDIQTKARLGVLSTAHGDIQTPFFMPVGTNATVKCLSFEDIRVMDAQIVLSNTYHLVLRPGLDILEKAGGLHRFINWNGPLLTDSGGYQVFSLSRLRKIADEGVTFQSHLDGSTHFFSPESVIDSQGIFGSDIMMPLDECVPYPSDKRTTQKALERTTQWAKRSKEQFGEKAYDEKGQQLFGIVQGATYKNLREQSAEEILNIGFDGYAIGGVSVGEPIEEMFKAIDWVAPLLPEDKPRYLMGIGMPDQIVEAVAEGVDMFDTCLPTRCGRHGTAFTSMGKILLRNAQYADDFKPIDENCSCMVCQNYSRSYIRHLATLKEITGLSLISYHNVFFYVNLMKNIRKALREERFAEFKEAFLRNYRGSSEQTLKVADS